jgi:membrane protease YdiL (CAAX protease family)
MNQVLADHSGPRPSNMAQRLLAVGEVIIVFALVHLSYRSFKHFTELGKLEGAAGLNFSTGSVMTLFTLAVLLLFGRSFEAYGLTLKEWRYSLNVGLLWGVLIVLGAAAIVKFARVHFDPRHPPDMTRAISFAVGALVATIVLLWFLMRERRLVRQTPAFVSLLILVGLLGLPLVLAWYSSRPLLNVLLTVLWLFFGAGLGEEIFFRGYIQSRLNQAFGRPVRFLGADFGLGLIGSSLLFGFIHVLNTVDYFSGRWDLAWWWWLPNLVTGLFYGYLREKTGSILAGGVVHGFTDVMAEVPALLR